MAQSSGVKPQANVIAAEPLLGAEALRAIKLDERVRFEQFDRGLLPHKYFLKPCNVKILILIDNGISFNQFYFGLSEVLDTLRNNPEWWVNFQVTRAHRQTDPNPPIPGSPAEALYAPHFENFHFDQPGFDINAYDQVWFFGFNSSTSQVGSPPPALTDPELAILFQWMDNGGGVFATGDHFTLGQSLCSRIPRVRNMRKWTVADGVPTNFGPDRHDTLLKGHDLAGTAVDESTRYTFDDESDDIPMKLRLRWYTRYRCGKASIRTPWFKPYFFKRHPHPVLCGSKGPIDVFPDHPHEGEVVQPTDLTDTLTFAGYTAPEYPNYGAAPLSPQIIAWARVQNDHGPSPISFKGAANGKEFGAVGAYNGHCVSVGRVVVDSTWHHWFDVNLTGRMFFGSDTPGSIETGDNRKLNGFNDTPAGQAALARIKNYYRNVAIWLSPPAKQRCMATRALWGCLHRFPLHADLHSKLQIWEIGHHAIEVLSKHAGYCAVIGWWPLLVPKFSLERFFDEDNIHAPVELLNMLDQYMIGGILQSMLVAKESGKHEQKQPTEDELNTMIERGAKLAIEEMLQAVERAEKTGHNLRDIMKKAL
jgi:hypothetical protein